MTCARWGQAGRAGDDLVLKWGKRGSVGEEEEQGGEVKVRNVAIYLPLRRVPCGRDRFGTLEGERRVWKKIYGQVLPWLRGTGLSTLLKYVS